MDSSVEAPPHYVEGRKYQQADVADDWQLHRHTAHALKYIARIGRKGSAEDAAKDARKAAWWLLRHADHLERGHAASAVLAVRAALREIDDDEFAAGLEAVE